jgi:hypothetical protein
MRDKASGLNSGYGFAEFNSAEAAQRVLGVLNGRPLGTLAIHPPAHCCPIYFICLGHVVLCGEHRADARSGVFLSVRPWRASAFRDHGRLSFAARVLHWSYMCPMCILVMIYLNINLLYC